MGDYLKGEYLVSNRHFPDLECHGSLDVVGNDKNILCRNNICFQFSTRALSSVGLLG